MGHFLWISDLHMDPFYGQKDAATSSNSNDCTKSISTISRPFGQVGCDAPVSLIEECLRHMSTSTAESSNQIDFILMTGDFSRHKTEKLNNVIVETTNILSNLSAAIQSTFPSIPIVPAIGNNDVFPDYFLDLEITNDNEILNISVEGLKKLFVSEEEIRSFSFGGYFSRNVSDSLTIISLNTVMYSINHQPSQTEIHDPMNQFEWFENQLKRVVSAGRVCYIVGHIPPSIGSFRHSQFWHEQYATQYFSILDTYKDSGVVVGHLFGHIHSEEFRLLQPFVNHTNLSIPVLIASSISPVYGVNPSYRRVQYDEGTGQLLDYTTSFLDLEETYKGMETSNLKPIWTELTSFTEAYKVSDLSSDSLQAVLTKLEEPSDYIWDTFLERQNVFSVISSEKIGCNDICRAEWICTLQAISKEGYTKCIQESRQYRSGVVKTVLDIFIVFLCILVVVALIVLFRRRKRRHYHSPVEGNNLDGTVGSDIGDIEARTCTKAVVATEKGEFA